MQTGRWFGPSSGVPDRLAAARAGLVQFGRNTFVAAPGIGSFINIHTFIVDAELEYDEPTTEMHCPPKCRICIEACPTGAIVADFRMNPRRCTAFNHFAAIEGLKNSSPYIDPAIRPKMGEWIHGCDVCQETCPRNQGKLKAKLPVNPFLAATAKKFSLTKLLDGDEECYAGVVGTLMYNYLRDQKYFQRNAAIAIANRGDRDAVPHLIRAMDNPEELVRAHVAWALGHLGGAEARAALETAAKQETGERAKEEIAAALAVA
jgi:epoxyqueuosine reductase